MTIRAIRDVHETIASEKTLGGDNLGLAFDRLVSEFDDPSAKEHCIKDKVLEIFSGYSVVKHQKLKESYIYAFNKWKEAVCSQEQTLAFDIVGLSKIILGSGNASALEVGVHLNRPWGVPYISGSSIKGVLASYLRNTKTLAMDSLEYVNIFGGNYNQKKYSGSVIFNDAWLYPDNESWFERDIINPHYQKYYSGTRFPDGMESPIPVQTLTLRNGLSFFVSMQGPEELLQYLKNVLQKAFEDNGIGAKTAVGYGRFKVVASEEERKSVEREVSRPVVAQYTAPVAVRPQTGYTPKPGNGYGARNGFNKPSDKKKATGPNAAQIKAMLKNARR